MEWRMRVSEREAYTTHLCTAQTGTNGFRVAAAATESVAGISAADLGSLITFLATPRQVAFVLWPSGQCYGVLVLLAVTAPVVTALPCHVGGKSISRNRGRQLFSPLSSVPFLLTEGTSQPESHAK